MHKMNVLGNCAQEEPGVQISRSRRYDPPLRDKLPCQHVEDSRLVEVVRGKAPRYVC
jgi:hypothetical protein